MLRLNLFGTFSATKVSEIPINMEADDISIDQIPFAENEHYEFKSSQAVDNKDAFAQKLSAALSGFANSGGGFFVVGIDDKSGLVDGGIPRSMGRQSLSDWIDTVAHKIEPTPKYSVKYVEYVDERGRLDTDKVVLVIAVEESHIGPHMAPDSKYYIHAGAHTVAARHFILEAIRAKRYQSKPKLTHLFRFKPGREQVLQLGFIALTDAAALDVNVHLTPLPKMLESRAKDFPIQIPVIDRNNPFFFDVSTFARSDELFGDNIILKIEYFDLLLNKYNQEVLVGVSNSTPPITIGNDYQAKTLKALESIEKALAKNNTPNRYLSQHTILPPVGIENVLTYSDDRLPELLNEMRNDLSKQPFVREFIIVGKNWLYNGDPNNDIFTYYFEEHSYLRNKIRVLENCGLVYNITFNSTDRFVITEQLARHLLK